MCSARRCAPLTASSRFQHLVSRPGGVGVPGLSGLSSLAQGSTGAPNDDRLSSGLDGGRLGVGSGDGGRGRGGGRGRLPRRERRRRAAAPAPCGPTSGSRGAAGSGSGSRTTARTGSSCLRTRSVLSQRGAARSRDARRCAHASYWVMTLVQPLACWPSRYGSGDYSESPGLPSRTPKRMPGCQLRIGPREVSGSAARGSAEVRPRLDPGSTQFQQLWSQVESKSIDVRQAERVASRHRTILIPCVVAGHRVFGRVWSRKLEASSPY
jgi:hypothetical protein